MSKRSDKPTPNYPMSITDAIAALITVKREPKPPKKKQREEPEQQLPDPPGEP